MIIKEYQVKKLFQKRFAVSIDTYDKVIALVPNDELMYQFLVNRNKLDVCIDKMDIETENEDIKFAMSYDKDCHPDEVVFVTDDKDIAEEANRFFGEDSIILI